MNDQKHNGTEMELAVEAFFDGEDRMPRESYEAGFDAGVKAKADEILQRLGQISDDPALDLADFAAAVGDFMRELREATNG